jgi:sugar lactone lactonase YvrE
MKTKTFVATLLAVTCLASLAPAQVTVSTVLNSGLSEPYGIAVDDNNNLYISDSANNRILKLQSDTGTVSVLAGLPEDGEFLGNDGFPWEAHFFSPQGLALARFGGADGLVIADTGNHTLRFLNLTNGYVQTLAGVAGEMGNAGGGPGVSRLNNPLGLASDGAGRIYVADSGNDAIRVLDLATADLSTLSTPGVAFNRPAAVALGASNQLWVADTANHVVRRLALSSSTTASLISVLGAGSVGTKDSVSGAAAQFNSPRGVYWWEDGAQLLISDTDNNTIRIAAANPTYGANNFSVTTFAGVAGQSGFTNGAALQSLFNNPIGLVLDTSAQAFLVADLKNNAIRRIQNGPVRPPVSTPRIGWVDFVWSDNLGTYVTVLRTDDAPRTFNNLVDFALLQERGTECHYTTANTPWPPGFADYGENPSKSVGATPPIYLNDVPKALYEANPPALQVERSTTLGGVVIKAVGFQVGRQNSPIAKVNYAFKTATPVITGNNLATFKVSSVTTNPPATVYYTVNGNDPTEQDTAVPINGQLQLQFAPGQTNLTLKARAFADTFLPSDVSQKTFSATNFIPTRITLGFPSGEASSRFIAAPGQTFYAPITLQMAEREIMYSLQFNLMVTNLAAAPKVSGRLDFASMLYEQVPVDKGEKAPPGQKLWFRTIPPAMWFDFSDPNAPLDRLIVRESDPTIPLMDLTFYDSSAGLIGVGWIERWMFKDLYDTTKQDLIKYSIARDNLFTRDGKRVVLGAGAFEVPATASGNAQYQLTLGRPSATSDGVGAPGSYVDIAAPITGHLTNGGLYAQRVVTMGQEKYIVGDVAPFRWLNAGDFGNSNLLSDDVLQVFECSVYNLSPTNPATGFPNDPPFYSDLRDAMDAGPILGVESEEGYFVRGTPVASINALFNGDDTSINSIAFGDGLLDVADVYITFRRSLDPSLTWWRRFYANGERVAEPVRNGPPPPATPGPPASPPPPADPAAVAAACVQFTAGDAIASGGSSVQIPIRAKIQGDYPLRVLMLGLSVEALDGAPALEEAVQFTPVAALGAPTLGGAARLNGYAAAWLNGQITGLTGDALLGTLTIRLPANAPASAAYAVHFVHVSASPNGLATFPCQTQTGLVTLSDRSASSRGDGISDAWRLRFFGSVNALLAGADADADGDGHANRAEFKTGTNPNDSLSVLKLLSKRASSTPGLAVRWASVAGKRYVIERSASLFGGDWIPVSTHTGTGGEMEFADPDTSPSVRFYRVRVAE